MLSRVKIEAFIYTIIVGLVINCNYNIRSGEGEGCIKDKDCREDMVCVSMFCTHKRNIKSLSKDKFPLFSINTVFDIFKYIFVESDTDNSFTTKRGSRIVKDNVKAEVKKEKIRWHCTCIGKNQGEKGKLELFTDSDWMAPRTVINRCRELYKSLKISKCKYCECKSNERELQFKVSLVSDKEDSSIKVMWIKLP